MLWSGLKPVYGYKSVDEIGWKHYKTICDAIESKGIPDKSVLKKAHSADSGEEDVPLISF